MSLIEGATRARWVAPLLVALGCQSGAQSGGETLNDGGNPESFNAASSS